MRQVRPRTQYSPLRHEIETPSIPNDHLEPASTTKNNFEAPVWASHVNLDALQEEIRIYGLHGTFEAMERLYSFIHFRERYFEAQRVQFHRLIPYSSQSMS